MSFSNYDSIIIIVNFTTYCECAQNHLDFLYYNGIIIYYVQSCVNKMFLYSSHTYVGVTVHA